MSRPSLLLFAAFLPDASLPSSSLSAASLACPPLRVRGGFPSSFPTRACSVRERASNDARERRDLTRVKVKEGRTEVKRVAGAQAV